MDMKTERENNLKVDKKQEKENVAPAEESPLATTVVMPTPTPTLNPAPQPVQTKMPERRTNDKKDK